MGEPVEDLRVRADRLLDALDAYERFVDEWLHGPPPVSAREREPLADPDDRTAGGRASRGERLALTVTDLYGDAHDAQAAAV